MDHRGKATTGSHLTPTFPPGRAPTWSILDGWKHYIDTFGRATQLDGANSEESTHTNLYCIHIINLRTWYQLPGHWKYPSHPTLSFSGELQIPLGTDHACLRPKSCRQKLSTSRRDTTHGRRAKWLCTLWENARFAPLLLWPLWTSLSDFGQSHSAYRIQPPNNGTDLFIRSYHSSQYPTSMLYPAVLGLQCPQMVSEGVKSWWDYQISGLDCQRWVL